MKNDTLFIPSPEGHVHVATDAPVSFGTGELRADRNGRVWHCPLAMRVCRKCGWEYATGEPTDVVDGRAVLLPFPLLV